MRGTKGKIRGERWKGHVEKGARGWRARQETGCTGPEDTRETLNNLYMALGLVFMYLITSDIGDDLAESGLVAECSCLTGVEVQGSGYF